MHIDVEKSSAFIAKSRSKFGWKNYSHKMSKYNFVNSKKVGPCFYCEIVDHHIKKEYRNYLKKQEAMNTKSSDKDKGQRPEKHVISANRSFYLAQRKQHVRFS